MPPQAAGCVASAHGSLPHQSGQWPCRAGSGRCSRHGGKHGTTASSYRSVQLGGCCCESALLLVELPLLPQGLLILKDWCIHPVEVPATSPALLLLHCCCRPAYVRSTTAYVGKYSHMRLAAVQLLSCRPHLMYWLLYFAAAMSASSV